MFDLCKRELIYARKQRKTKKITFAEYVYLGTRQSVHSAKAPALPSAFLLALGKDGRFVECQILDTRQSLGLCRVPVIGHSAKRSCLPSVFYLTLGKANANSNWAGRFALCCRVFFFILPNAC